ncbi:MAG: response regulator [Mariniphaga sp.]
MKKFKILVIDDQTDDRISLEEILVANDFLVLNASGREEAEQLLSEELVDLIFIDGVITGIQPLSTAKLIKTNENWKDIPIIFMVGKDDLRILKELYQSGGDDYIIKPFTWSELLMKTRLHLELKYSRQMAKNTNQMLESRVIQRTNELEASLKKLREANKELGVLEIAKSEFFNLISHEIRTPLNGILGSLALIDRLKLPDDVNHYFSLLDLSVKRLEDFSNTILEASKLRIKGVKALVFMETDLVMILQDAISECSTKFCKKNISVDLQNYTSGTPLLKADHKYLLKCFNVILDNSFKFSPGGGKIEISIIAQPPGFLKTVISDYGTGFSKASLENIYHGFANLNAHFDQNTGMGLHLAKLIIDAHSGFIKVGNNNPTGAIVEILIPVDH